MALVAIASFIGRAAFRAAVHDVAAEAAGHAVTMKAVRDFGQRLEAEQRPRVLGIGSETWYAFRLADEDYWRRANQLLADELGLRVSREYLRYTGRTGSIPFVLAAQQSREGVTCNFRRAPRSGGINRAELRETIIGAVRNSMRNYVRAAASGQLVGD